MCDSGEEVNEANIVQVSKWLLCVYKSMDEFGRNDDVLTQLRSLKMVPLTSGRVTSTSVDTIFFPIMSTLDKRGYCLYSVSENNVLSLTGSRFNTYPPICIILSTCHQRTFKNQLQE